MTAISVSQFASKKVHAHTPTTYDKMSHESNMLGTKPQLECSLRHTCTESVTRCGSHAQHTVTHTLTHTHDDRVCVCTPCDRPACEPSPEAL